MPRAVVLPAARLSAGTKLEIQMFHPRIRNTQPACHPWFTFTLLSPTNSSEHGLEMAVTPNPQHVVPPGGHKHPKNGNELQSGAPNVWGERWQQSRRPWAMPVPSMSNSICSNLLVKPIIQPHLLEKVSSCSLKVSF